MSINGYFSASVNANSTGMQTGIKGFIQWCSLTFPEGINPLPLKWNALVGNFMATQKQ